jgi:hypothetical protein
MDSTRAPNALVFPGKNRLLLIMRIAGTFRRRTVASFQNAHFAFAIGNFSHRRTYTCDIPRLGSDEHGRRRNRTGLFGNSRAKHSLSLSSHPMHHHPETSNAYREH